MKNEDIRALTLEELKAKITDEKDKYQKLKFAHAISPIENPSQLKELRRTIARLNTELSVKQKAVN